MSRSFRVPGAARLPGRARPDTGAVTVEAAVSLLALAGVVGMLLFGIGLLGAQLAVGEASRVAARAAARGEAPASVVVEARRLAPGAEVVLRGSGDRVEVEVIRLVTPPGLLARLGPFRLAAVSTAALEPVVSKGSS